MVVQQEQTHLQIPMMEPHCLLFFKKKYVRTASYHRRRGRQKMASTLTHAAYNKMTASSQDVTRVLFLDWPKLKVKLL